ncbi:hypothetical protein DRO97_05090 [Archaeoglobales archaeon]|nr:MAG: hypothetical protein DRO97_05090 [Archaeoglobales archaeon]
MIIEIYNYINENRGITVNEIIEKFGEEAELWLFVLQRLEHIKIINNKIYPVEWLGIVKVD